jgi:hypothetical protein
VNVLLIASQIANAAEGAPLGAGNFAIKVDYIKFTDDIPEKRKVNKALYIGFEGFFGVQPNLYLGGEIGYGHDEGEYQGTEDFDSTVDDYGYNSWRFGGQIGIRF